MQGAVSRLLNSGADPFGRANCRSRLLSEGVNCPVALPLQGGKIGGLRKPSSASMLPRTVRWNPLERQAGKVTVRRIGDTLPCACAAASGIQDFSTAALCQSYIAQAIRENGLPAGCSFKDNGQCVGLGLSNCGDVFRWASTGGGGKSSLVVDGNDAEAEHPCAVMFIVELLRIDEP